LKDFIFLSQSLIYQSLGVSEAHASHSAHSSHTAGHASSTTSRSSTSWLWLVDNHGLRGDHERSNTGSIDEGGSDDLCGVNDTGFHHVDVLTGGGVVSALQVGSLEELVDNDRAFVSSILADSLDGDLASFSYNIDTDALVEVFSFDVVKSLRSKKEGGTTAGNDSFIGRSSDGAESILNTILELADLDFRCSTDLDDSDSSGKSANTLLDLLLIVLTGGTLHLVSESFDALSDLSGFSSSSHDDDIVLGDDNLLGSSHAGDISGGNALTEVFGNELSTSSDSNILHSVASVVSESR